MIKVFSKIANSRLFWVLSMVYCGIMSQISAHMWDVISFWSLFLFALIMAVRCEILEKIEGKKGFYG